MNRKQLEESILEDLTVKRPKAKRRRKPMTPEQKAAAAERLAKAREKRQKANPPKYANVHASVLALPDDHPFSRKAVTDWIKHQKELLSEYRRQERMKMKGVCEGCECSEPTFDTVSGISKMVIGSIVTMAKMQTRRSAVESSYRRKLLNMSITTKRRRNDKYNKVS